MNLDNRGVIGTIIFHGVLLLIFIYAGFTTHLPLPAEKGILINFGDVAEAGGRQEPVFNVEKVVKAKPKVVQEPAEKIKTKETTLTQDFEEAPSIKKKEKPKKKETIKIKEEIKPVTETNTTEPKVETPKEVKPTVNANALYQGRKKNTNYTGSEGVGNGEGNQGSLSGSENATDRSLYGGSGGGTSFSLEGRNSLDLPIPDKNLQKEGRVVVEIKVDRAGNVIGAIPGVKGSTTLDNQLLSAAKKAALSSRFDSKADAAFTQVGTITYIFKLK
jgi:colicin import membrane protein